MTKRSIFMLVLLVLVITFVSCAPVTSNCLDNEVDRVSESLEEQGDKQHEEPTIQSNGYSVKLTSSIENGIFKEGAETAPPAEFSKESLLVPLEETIKIGQKEITADFTAVLHYTAKPDWNIYLSKSRDVEYRKNTCNDSFSIQSKGDIALSSFPDVSLTEESLINHINEFVSSYIDLNLFDDYIYSCSSSVAIVQSDAAWNEVKSMFYLPQNETEKVRSYSIVYRKYSKNLKTEDEIVIQCNSNGDITMFGFYNCNANWEEVSFEDERVNRSVEKYLSDNMSTKYVLAGYEIKSRCLIYANAEILLSLTVESILVRDGEEITFLCELVVLPSLTTIV